MNSWEAFVLPNPSGIIIQYSFPLGPFEVWLPAKDLKAYDFQKEPNSLQIETVGGVSELLLSDSHDFCNPSCKYLGTFDAGLPSVAVAALPDGAVYETVSGTLTGTFTDAFGKKYTNVLALFSFTTYPGAGVPAVGYLTVVLQDN